MKNFHLKLILILLMASIISTVWGQQNPIASVKGGKAVVITGARFSYPLLQKWIDEYNQIDPSVQIIIESRGTTDPATYDILAEAYEQEEAIKKSRDYAYIARYPILPVANSRSTFAKFYSDKGLNRQLITQLFFHDIYADKEKEQAIKFPYVVYNRLQKAGAPIVFTTYFGFAQKDIRGKAIAGADEHLLKALLRDSIGVSYLPLTLIYDRQTGKAINGLTVLPVDLNGNGKVSDDEKFYTDLSSVILNTQNKDQSDLNNLPVGSLHLSVSKTNAKPEAIAFLRWVVAYGQKDLAEYGYLKPADKLNSELFASAHPN